jgi:hypothetical protein
MLSYPLVCQNKRGPKNDSLVFCNAFLMVYGMQDIKPLHTNDPCKHRKEISRLLFSSPQQPAHGRERLRQYGYIFTTTRARTGKTPTISARASQTILQIVFFANLPIWNQVTLLRIRNSQSNVQNPKNMLYFRCGKIVIRA